MAPDPYKYFRVEARELLEQLGQGGLDLEKGKPSGEVFARMLRLAHTLKGAARVVKLPQIADHAHRLEDVLTSLRDAPGPPAREHIDSILALVDHSAQSLATLAPAREPGEAHSPAPVDEPLQAFRADADDMQRLIDGIANVQSELGTLRPAVEGADSIRELFDLLGHQLFRLRGIVASTGGDTTGADRALSTTEELRRQFGSFTKAIARGVEQADRELGQVGDAATRLRLVPASAVFPFLERAARDAARALGKRVAFEARGGDVRMDSDVLTVLQRALLQLVRNAVAHGIEAGDHERRAAGKPAEGRVTLVVSQQGTEVSFVCSDDGRGVDIDAVRQRLGSQASPEGSGGTRDTDDVLRLLLQGGISTAATVTGISGRGVGLDVVRDVAERLSGHTRLRTERGMGTSIELTVPFSMALVPALIVEAAGIGVAVPLDGVRGVFRVTPEAIVATADGDMVMHDGRAIPFRSLGRVLSDSVPARSAGRAVAALVLQDGDAAAAFAVDRLVDVTPVVVRPLPALALALPAVTGASLDAGGAPRLVVDARSLLREAQRQEVRPLSAVERPASILVIDDSLTTRMLEQSILESAGYQVTLASSAEEGLEKARQDVYALFMVDVEMPGMDGFTFVEQVRADPVLASIPAILITSRASAEDKLRGRTAGAQAYIVKGEFDQRVLLEHIERLVQ